MITDSKVVIINKEGKLIPIGKINTGTLHSKIISDYLKTAYPKIKNFQNLDMTTDLITLMYFMAMTDNILLINTRERSQKLSCTLVLPVNYKEKLREIRGLLSFFKDYEMIIEAYPMADNGLPKFQKEAILSHNNNAVSTFEEFLNLDSDKINSKRLLK